MISYVSGKVAYRNIEYSITLETQDGHYPEVLGYHGTIVLKYQEKTSQKYIGKLEASIEDAKNILIRKGIKIAETWDPYEPEPKIDISDWKP